MKERSKGCGFRNSYMKWKIKNFISNIHHDILLLCLIICGIISACKYLKLNLVCVGKEGDQKYPHKKIPCSLVFTEQRENLIQKRYESIQKRYSQREQN